MKIKKSRFIALMTLAAVILLFTGAANFVADATLSKAEKSSCGCCGHGEKGIPIPHSTPPCPAFLCLAIDIIAPVTPQFIPLKTVFVFFYNPPTIAPYVKSIFRPPTTA